MIPLTCLLCEIPATKNDALIGRPRISKVPRTVRHKGSKVVNLSIELRYVVFKLWWKQTLQGNCQKKKMCRARSRNRWRSKTTDQAGWALMIRIGFSLFEVVTNLTKFEIVTNFTKQSQIWDRHKFDQTISNLRRTKFEVVTNLTNLPSRSRWNLMRVPPVKGVNMQMKWFQPWCIFELAHPILSFLWISKNYICFFVLIETPDTLLLDSQNRRGGRGGRSWWCQILSHHHHIR